MEAHESDQHSGRSYGHVKELPPVVQVSLVSVGYGNNIICADDI